MTVWGIHYGADTRSALLTPKNLGCISSLRFRSLSEKCHVVEPPNETLGWNACNLFVFIIVLWMMEINKRPGYTSTKLFVQRIMKKAVVTTSIDTTTTTSKKDELQRYRLSKWFSLFIFHLFSWFSLSYCLICKWHRTVLEMKQLPDKRSLNRRLSRMLKTNQTQPVSH